MQSRRSFLTYERSRNPPDVHRRGGFRALSCRNLGPIDSIEE